MGDHIDSEGRFQSDKFPDLAPDKIVLSFKDPAARPHILGYATDCEDRELAADIQERMFTISMEERGDG